MIKIIHHHIWKTFRHVYTKMVTWVIVRCNTIVLNATTIFFIYLYNTSNFLVRIGSVAIFRFGFELKIQNVNESHFATVEQRQNGNSSQSTRRENRSKVQRFQNHAPAQKWIAKPFRTTYQGCPLFMNPCTDAMINSHWLTPKTRAGCDQHAPWSLFDVCLAFMMIFLYVYYMLSCEQCEFGKSNLHS